jgi:hypothetical protein
MHDFEHPIILFLLDRPRRIDSLEGLKSLLLYIYTRQPGPDLVPLHRCWLQLALILKQHKRGACVPIRNFR